MPDVYKRQAYKELKESGDVDLSQYEYAYDISK